MTITEKKELIAKIVTMLDQLIPADEKTTITNFPKYPDSVEMLTIKECAESIKDYPSTPSVSLLLRRRYPLSARDKAGEEKFL